MKKSLLILLLCAASTFTGNALSTKDGFYETNIANSILDSDMKEPLKTAFPVAFTGS